jgi:hypothetical protein
MAGGAYRDTSAAIERAEALAREVEDLRAEVARLREAPKSVSALLIAKLQAELAELRTGRGERKPARADVDRPRAAPGVMENGKLRAEVAKLHTEVAMLRAQRGNRTQPPAFAPVLPSTKKMQQELEKLRAQNAALSEELKKAGDAPQRIAALERALERMRAERDELAERVKRSTSKKGAKP